MTESMTAENQNALLDATEELVYLRIEREDLSARIATLESNINHLVGSKQLIKKLYGDLLRVKMA